MSDMVTEFRTLADGMFRLEIDNHQLQAELAKENREIRLKNARLRSLTEASNVSSMFSKTTTSLPTFTDQAHPPSMAYVSTKILQALLHLPDIGHVVQPTTHREDQTPNRL